MKYWLIDAFNISKIKTKLEEKYNIESIDTRFIYSFIFTCRKIIASYSSNVYSLEILASNNLNMVVCVDESLFTHQQGIQT